MSWRSTAVPSASRLGGDDAVGRRGCRRSRSARPRGHSSLPISAPFETRQTRPSPSSPAVATESPVRAERRPPRDDTAVPELAQRPLPVGSQTRAIPSAPAVTTRPPAASKATERSGAPCSNEQHVRRRLPDARPWRRRPAPAVTRSDPSRDSARSTTGPGWGIDRTARAVPSPDRERRSRPTLRSSGTRRRAERDSAPGRAVAADERQDRIDARAPDPRRAVFARGDDAAAVRV